MKAIIICGPTASGKTSLALRIAELLPRANILSVDSRQVYQGLDLVTGKDIPSDLPTHIHLYGLDLIPANQTMNLAEFVQYATPIISDSVQNNIPLIIVGGTGLYLKALTQSLSHLSTPPDLSLRKDLEKLDTESLQDLLFDINPEKVLSLNNSDIYNPRRLIRAIEISKSSPQTLAKTGMSNDATRHYEPCTQDVAIYKNLLSFCWIGLKPNSKSQKDNIRKRVIERLKSGAIQEVKDLIQKYPNRNLPILTSLGVKEIMLFLSDQITEEQLVDLWTTAEVDYARRQIVWFKKQPDIIWYDKSSKQLVTQLIKIFQKDD